jgi:hypothetical protein
MIDLVIWGTRCHESYSDKAFLRLSIDLAHGASAQQLPLLFCRHVLARTRVIQLLLTQMWHRPRLRAPAVSQIFLVVHWSWNFLILFRIERILPRNLMALGGSLSCIVLIIVFGELLRFGKINHALTFVWYSTESLFYSGITCFSEAISAGNGQTSEKTLRS